jgi:hypothetical protein
MAAPALILTAVTPAKTISLNLSTFLQLQPGTQMDPYNPAFTNKVFSHSLLKEGGTLALESLALKELQFPLRLKAASASALAELIQELNQVINSPGATVSWQDEGMSQATYFDLASGQFDITYTFREAAQHFQAGNLRLFSQPLGRTAAPRAFAAASGVGPLLMISPYASGGALTIAASEQAGVKGFGGKQQPSGGVFYQGNPSLAGDASALLQLALVQGGEKQNPWTTVSVLPDEHYVPLRPISELGAAGNIVNSAVGVGSQYASMTKEAVVVRLEPTPLGTPGVLWAGNHRLFAIARASTANCFMETAVNSIVPYAVTASVVASGAVGDWSLYDLGVASLRASENPYQSIEVTLVASTGTLDVTAMVMLPDATTWFWNGASAIGNKGTKQLVIADDVMGDQFAFPNNIYKTAPSPAGLTGSGVRITEATRGLVPRPEPRQGVPIIAVLDLPLTITNVNQLTTAQVAVLERCRYILQ